MQNVARILVRFWVGGERTSNNKSKSQMRAFFAPLRMTSSSRKANGSCVLWASLHLGAKGLHWLGVGLHCGVGVDHVLFQELVVEAVEGELKAVGDAELVGDLAQVVLDYLLGGADLVSDFFVAHASGDAADDGQLLFGELGLHLGIGEAGGLGAIGLDDPADGLVVDPGLSLGDL